MTIHPDRLAEGLCPTHGTPLERLPEFGWCAECGLGWSLRPGELLVHLRYREDEP